MYTKMRKPKEGMVENTTFMGHTSNIINSIVLFAIAFCCVVPMWHVLMSSLSVGQSLFSHEGLVLLPEGGINLGGYELVIANKNILISYGITIFYVVATTLLGLILNVLAGYVLSRPSKMKSIFIMILMFTMMFSGGLIPAYMVVRSLGLVGTPWAVVLPGCTNAMFMILMMNGFNQVPQATVEAAQIDGAGHIRLMFQIMLPQAKGLALVTVINTALSAWNGWFEASIYVPNNQEYWPLQLWIRELTSNNQNFLNFANPDYNRYLIQYAVIVIATLPVLVLFPFFQKKLESSMVIGAVKE